MSRQNKKMNMDKHKLSSYFSGVLAFTGFEWLKIQLFASLSIKRMVTTKSTDGRD